MNQSSLAVSHSVILLIVEKTVKGRGVSDTTQFAVLSDYCANCSELRGV